MLLKGKRHSSPVDRELALVERREEKLAAAAAKRSEAKWKEGLEAKIPGKVYTGLESSFCKGFALVFDKGGAIIEKSYAVDKITTEHKVRDYAFRAWGSRRELRQLYKGAGRSRLVNMTVTTVEGLGLGFLGIGLPDLFGCGPSCGAVLAVADRFGFDPAQGIVVGQGGQTADDQKHQPAGGQQNQDLVWHG